PFVMVARGKVSLTAAMSAGDTGAEPIRTALTDDRSARAKSSGSRSSIDIIVGTEVSAVAMRTRRCDVARRCETRQQNDRVAVGDGSLRNRQRVHVIKRGCNERPFRRPTFGAAPHLYDPEMALMR